MVPSEQTVVDTGRRWWVLADIIQTTVNIRATWLTTKNNFKKRHHVLYPGNLCNQFIRLVTVCTDVCV